MVRMVAVARSTAGYGCVHGDGGGGNGDGVAARNMLGTLMVVLFHFFENLKTLKSRRILPFADP